MTTIQSHLVNPTGTVESMSATQPVAERRAMTADEKDRARGVLHRLMRATTAKRVNPSNTRVELLNAQFQDRINALAKKLGEKGTVPATVPTAPEKDRARRVLHRLIRATIAKRVNPSNTRVGLLNAQFQNRIAALAKKLGEKAPRRVLTPAAQPANANTSGTSRDHEG